VSAETKLPNAIRFRGEVPSAAPAEVTGDAGYVTYRDIRYVRGPRQILLYAGREYWSDDGTERVEVTEAMLREMVANAAYLDLIPINYDHRAGEGVGTPAAGLVRHDTLRVENGALSGEMAYTATAAEQMRAGERPAISAEFAQTFYRKDQPDTPLGAVLVGVGLLSCQPQQHQIAANTNFDAIRDTTGIAAKTVDNRQEPLNASRMDYKAELLKLLNLPADATDEQVAAKCAEMTKAAAEGGGEAEAAVAQMSATHRATVEKLTGERDGAKAEVAKLQAEVKRLGGEAAQAGELAKRVGDLEASIKRKEAEATVQAFGARVVPAEVPELVELCIAGGAGWAFAEKQIKARPEKWQGTYQGGHGGGPSGDSAGTPEAAWLKFRDSQKGDTPRERQEAALATDEGKRLFSAFSDSGGRKGGRAAA